MSDLYRAIAYLERTHRLMEVRNRWVEGMDLKALERLQDAIKKVDLLVSKQHMARIAEFRTSIISVARDPKLDKAQKVAQMAYQIEKLEKDGVIKLNGQRDLIGLGMLLIAIPEPTMVSDVLGLMLVAMGLVLQGRGRLRRP